MDDGHKPDRDRPSASPEYDYLKEVGEHFEALMMVHALIELGSEKTLNKKLAEIGYKKDTYYKRLKALKDATRGREWDEMIDQCLAWRSKAGPDEEASPPGPLNEIFEEIRRIREWYLWLCKTKSYRPRIRLGISPILARSILAPALQKYKEQYKAKFQEEKIPWFDGEIGYPDFEIVNDMSGRLRQLYDTVLLDIYVSKYQRPPAGRKPSLILPFCLICQPTHPAAVFARENPGKQVPLSLPSLNHQDLETTTLVLIGPHPNRSPQFIFPRDKFYDAAADNNLRIVEVDSFERAHSLVMCEPSYMTLSVPEFLDDEQLRLLEVIPNFKYQDETEPVELFVVREPEFPRRRRKGQPGEVDNQRRVPVKSGDPPAESGKENGNIRLAVLDHLAQALEDYLQQLQDEQLKNGDIQDFGQDRWVYYARTINVGGNLQTVWVASELKWHFLRNRCIKGLHKVEQKRKSDGSFTGYHQEFQILGRLDRQEPVPHQQDGRIDRREGDKKDDQLYLHWDGLFCGNSGYRERYFASFVCPERTLRSQTWIVGQWSGLSNDRYTPGGGYMILSPSLSREEPLGKAPTLKNAKDLLDHLCDLATSFRKKAPGLAEPPRTWEWEETQSLTTGGEQ